MLSFIKNVLIIILIITLWSNSYALKPSRNYRVVPSTYGLIYKDVHFQTKDGITIKGWFFPAQDDIGLGYSEENKLNRKRYKTLDDLKRPTVVICNGDAGNMDALIVFPINLVAKGFNVLTFDWRGFGESDDWPIETDYLCYPEFLLDYDAAIDFVKTLPEVDINRIGIFGFSTGAYLSFAIAAKRNDVAAFAGRALLTSFEDVLPILKSLNPDRNPIAPPNYPEKLLPINCADKVTIPVFLIVGEKDIRTPPWMSKKIMEKLKDPKKLWIVPNAEHGGIKGPEYANYPEFYNRLAEIYKQYLSNE